jgi:Rod binding domain-containing protein
MAMEMENVAATAHVAQKTADPKAAKLLKACKDFESVFVSYLLKTMRSEDTEEDGDSFWPKGLGGSMFQDLYETEMSKTVSSGPGIGLGAMLFRSMEPYLKSLSPASAQSSGATPAGSGADSFPTSDASPQPGLSTSIHSAWNKIKNFSQPIAEAVGRFNVDPALLCAVITQESGGNPGEVSSKGAKGLMQLMDDTAREMGVQNSLNPRENILGGAQYLRQMLDRFGGDVKLALAAYNAGPGAVERHGGVPPYTETRNYVNRVLEHYEQYQTALKGGQGLA